MWLQNERATAMSAPLNPDKDCCPLAVPPETATSELGDPQRTRCESNVYRTFKYSTLVSSLPLLSSTISLDDTPTDVSRAWLQSTDVIVASVVSKA